MGQAPLASKLQELEEGLNRLLTLFHAQLPTIQQLKKENKLLKQELSQIQATASFRSRLKFATIRGVKAEKEVIGEQLGQYIKALDESIRYLEGVR